MLEKWTFLGQNHGLTPFGKCQFFEFFNYLFLYSRKAFFRSRIISKTFSWPLLPPQKVRIIAIFGPKPWVNPFGKMSIFLLFEILDFMAQKGVFSFQNIIKDIFVPYIAKKKKLEKRPFSDQNRGLIPLEKCQFST